jgi:aspartyl-tRNA(Asn)/glutamyl-tRNA(Gln) amidotransferase subunit A
VVRRLRGAGAVIVAKTNMTEFAFHSLGTNPHFGTPGNPADRARVPGGSTSGGAVAVADGMCEIAIGSDTGGSTRIPAALCGVVGWKPSRQRVPTDGAFPLSYTLDSVGPIARNVADCAKTDAIMAGDAPHQVESPSLAGLRLGIPQGFPLDDLDEAVATAWSAALGRLGQAGVQLSDEKIPLLAEMIKVNSRGGFSPAEAFVIHRERLLRRATDLDPNVRARIERGSSMSAADYIEMQRERAMLVRAMDDRIAGFDALILPTTPIVAPRIAEVATPEAFAAKNMTLLRNTSLVNFFDLCAISLPLPRGSGLPVGLMLAARNRADWRLLRIATSIERLLAG